MKNRIQSGIMADEAVEREKTHWEDEQKQKQKGEQQTGQEEMTLVAD